METIRNKLGLPLNLRIRYVSQAIMRCNFNNPIDWSYMNDRLMGLLERNITANVCNEMIFGLSFSYITYGNWDINYELKIK